MMEFLAALIIGLWIVMLVTLVFSFRFFDSGSLSRKKAYIPIRIDPSHRRAAPPPEEETPNVDEIFFFFWIALSILVIMVIARLL